MRRVALPLLALLLCAVILACEPDGAAITAPLATDVVASEPAAQADSLVNSIGVQTHLGYSNVYATGWSTIIRPRLLELGVRHIRDALSATSTVIARDQDLAAQGIRLTGGCNPKTKSGGTYDRSNLANDNWTNAAHCLTQAAALGPAVLETFEGVNEPDIKGDANWPTYWVQWQAAMWQAIRGSPTWTSRPLYSGPLAHSANAAKLGNRSAVLDFGAMHPYPGGLEPSQVSVSNIPNYTPLATPKPLVATETGYHNATSGSQPGVSELAGGKYTGRQWVEYFNRHVARTFAYELINQGTSLSAQESNWGLLRHDGSPKPAFTVTKNLIALLADPGPSFAPGALAYTLTGALSTTHHTLLQKRDGRFDLVLWQELSSYDRVNKRDLTNADDALTLTLAIPASAIRVYRPRTGTAAIQTGSGTTIRLSVPDEVIVVELIP